MARSSARPVVYLVGTSGHPNYGDEIITAGWLRFYAEHAPDADVWLDSPRPGSSAVLFDGLHPRLRCVDTLFHGCWNAPSEDADDAAAFGARLLDEPGLIPREATGLGIVANADVIHVLGGGYVNTIWPRHLSLLGTATAAAERGATVLMTGAGLTPADGMEGALRRTLSKFTLVDVRDAASHALLAGHVTALHQTGDDAFLDLQGTPVSREPMPRTVLCLQEDIQQTDQQALADYVTRSLQSWGVADDPVLLLECLPPNDLHIAERLRAHLPALVTQPFARLWAEGFPMARGQRWISTRFHPHLMAAAGGVGGVAIASVDYYRTKHQSLVDLGSGWAIAESFDDIVDPGGVATAPYAGNLPSMQRAKRAIAATAVGALRT